MVKHHALISIARGCTNQERVWVGKLFGEPTKLTDPGLFLQCLSITGAGLDFPLAHPMDSNPSVLAQESARHRNHSQTDSIVSIVGIVAVTDSRTAVFGIVVERAAAQHLVVPTPPIFYPRFRLPDTQVLLNLFPQSDRENDKELKMECRSW